ncbi:hypothetical protein Tco_1108639 [Tanacetum coccineum]
MLYQMAHLPQHTVDFKIAPSPSNSHTTQETQTPIISHDVEEDNHDIKVAHMGNDPYFGIPIPEVTSDQSSSSDVIHTIVTPDSQVLNTWRMTKDHPLVNIIVILTDTVSIGTKYSMEQALFCYYDAFSHFSEVRTTKTHYSALVDESNCKWNFMNLNVLKFEDGYLPPDIAFVINIKWIIRLSLMMLGDRGLYEFFWHLLLLMNMVVFQMFCRTAFLNGNLREEKYGFESCDPVDTPMVEKSKLDEDKEGKADSSISLIAFEDADHAGCQDTRRNTSVLWMRHKSYDYALDSIKFQCIVITKRYCAYAATTFNIPIMHIDIDFTLHQGQPVDNGVIELYFCQYGVEYQLADIFTTSLVRERRKN